MISLEPRHRCQAINYQTLMQGSFADSIQKTQQLITQSNQASDHSQHEKRLRMLTPFEYPNTSKRAIVLLHGLYDSPFLMRDLADYFYQQGFTVRCLLLPGHGTQPGDLLKVSYQDWLAMIRFACQDFAEKFETFYLAGFSTGAAVALHHVLSGGISCQGLLLFSPALFLKNRFAFLCHWHHLYAWCYPRGRWLRVASDEDAAKYQSHCVNAVCQLLDLLQSLNKYDHKNLPPIFTALSADDEVLNIDAVLKWFKAIPNKKNILRFYTTQKQSFSDSRIQVVDSHYPQERILNFSHTCLVTAPYNQHYGQQGEFADFIHYADNPNLNIGGDKTYLGAIHADQLAQYHLQRLHYNPDFEGMTHAVTEFLSS